MPPAHGSFRKPQAQSGAPTLKGPLEAAWSVYQWGGRWHLGFLCDCPVPPPSLVRRQAPWVHGSHTHSCVASQPPEDGKQEHFRCSWGLKGGDGTELGVPDFPGHVPPPSPHLPNVMSETSLRSRRCRGGAGGADCGLPTQHTWAPDASAGKGTVGMEGGSLPSMVCFAIGPIKPAAPAAQEPDLPPPTLPGGGGAAVGWA